MRINLTTTVAKLAILGALLITFAAKPVSAQVFQGKFSLPATTRWNLATLPAGDYSFALDHAYAGGVITVSRGSKVVARVQASAVSNIDSGRPELAVENGTIRRMTLPQVGVSFDYPARTSAKTPETQTAQIIPIIPGSSGQ
jgi:hypothetical protein